MSDILKDVSIIIGYRQASADRKLGLQFVLNWLYKYLPEVEILLIEQDETQKIDVALPPNCKYYFTYNPGLYNRCWAFNVGINLTDKKIFAFSDSDMFMPREDYIRAFEACRTFQAVNPNGDRVFNIINAEPDALTYEISEKRKLWTMAAGLLIMQREAMELIAGWDERFEGWGAEDNAISHLIYQTLTTKTLDCMMYHVDHARSVFDGNTQPGYLYNQMLCEEIMTLYGTSLSRFLEKQKKVPRGNPDLFRFEDNKTVEKNLHFVLAVTTYNRVKYIREFMESWDQTRSKNIKWTIILADDGSNDGTLDYLDNVRYDNTETIILRNNRLGIAGQTNTIIDRLMAMEFDLCFCCNDDILFVKEGWEFRYREVIERTGYDHLCYYDKNWKPANNLENPLIRGQLCNPCAPENLQGCFFTLTPEVIKTVGYFDLVNFGFRGLAHVDYTWRCCRGGFNALNTPFDLVDSNDFIETQKENYLYSIPQPIQKKINQAWEKEKKWKIIRMSRLYIPKNELNVIPEILQKYESGDETVIRQFTEIKKQPPGPAKESNDNKESVTDVQSVQMVRDNSAEKIRAEKNYSKEDDKQHKNYVFIDPGKLTGIHAQQVYSLLNKEVYTYADDKFKPNDGVGGLIGSIGKKFYNFCLHHRIHFIIKGMDKLANGLLKTSINIKNIDTKSDISSPLKPH